MTQYSAKIIKNLGKRKNKNYQNLNYSDLKNKKIKIDKNIDQCLDC